MAGEQKIEVKPTAKKAEVQKAVAKAWRPGQLPKVIADDWRQHVKDGSLLDDDNLRVVAFAPAAPKKRAAKRGNKSKAGKSKKRKA